MNTIQLHADMIMCLAWVITYSLVLISTCKTRIPAMHPMACAVIFPWEFAMLCKHIIGNAQINYAVMGHCGFAALDLAIILVILFRLKYYNKKESVLYLLFIAGFIVLMSFIFSMPKGILYTSYINTIIGVIIWVFYVTKSGYPLTSLNLIILMVKLIADVLGWIVYHEHDAIVFILSTLLPVIDVLHIITFLVKKYKKTVNAQ